MGETDRGTRAPKRVESFRQSMCYNLRRPGAQLSFRFGVSPALPFQSFKSLLVEKTLSFLHSWL